MLWWFAQTTLIAGALAVVATLAGRWKRLGPEVKHALWLVVLIKLAIPPLVAWPWMVPDAWPGKAEPVVVAAAVEASPLIPDALPPPSIVDLPPSVEEVADATEVPDASQAPALLDLGPIETRAEAVGPPALESGPRDGKWEIWNLNSALLALWLAGSVAVVARRGIKILRFQRGLAASRPAPDWLVEQARAIGDRVGVRPPPVVSTSRVGTPLLWCLGRPRLILPDVLIERLEADRWPGILAHELAHLARRDHWVVRLELLVEAAWWWNPLFWHARRRVHEEAEVACDARVVRSLPERRYAYAEALVDVCEQIARASSIPSPALGVGGAGSSHSLEGRLHMILRDPIPRRPTRRGSLAALLLGALTLPAWTLGQQPDATRPAPQDAPPLATKADASAIPVSPKPDTPAEPAPATAPKPARPATADVTHQMIETARRDALRDLGNLSFRYVVASRDQSRQAANGPYGQAATIGGWVAPTTQRRKVVRVQVADVILWVNPNFSPDIRDSRLDVIEARPALAAPRPLAWDRRFVAKNQAGFMALEIANDQSGPVPFRWLGAAGRQSTPGDSLASAFQQGSIATDWDRGIDPLDPRPANLLDIVGATSTFLDTRFANAEVVGLDSIDGRDVVRVAWIANADARLRGLCWLAPDLGYAVVRSDATMDPTPPNIPFPQGRRSWRKRSSGFVKVANFWLPRKILYEESAANVEGGDPIFRRERDITIEDPRIAPGGSDAFRPKLAIQTLDDLSGNFTAQPPELPPGLVDRLDRAVRESYFGPPIDEKTTEEVKPAPANPTSMILPGQPNRSQPATPMPAKVVAVAPAQDVDIHGFKYPAPAELLAAAGSVPDPAKADPKIIVKPSPVFDGSIPTLDPKIDDPISPKPLAGRDTSEDVIKRRFNLDPEVNQLKTEIKAAQDEVGRAQRLSRNPGDPNLKNAKRKQQDLLAKYNRLWESRRQEWHPELEPAKISQARDELEVLQARRDGKLAEIQKAKAQQMLTRAVVHRNETLKKKGPNFVSLDEITRAEAEDQVAEAEVAARKAALDEADAYLNQAKRRLGLATAASPPADPAPAKAPLPVVVADPKVIDREIDDQDGRDEVALAQARRDGKFAEGKKAEAHLERVRKDWARAQTLFVDKNAIGRVEYEQFATDLKLAEADTARKKADFDEAETFLTQAKRRAGGRPKAAPGTSAPSAPTQADLRDAVELMEVQLQGKQAELRGVEAKTAGAQSLADRAKADAQQGQGDAASKEKFANLLEIARADLEAKKDEVLEFEIRIRQARRRADANEARLRREVERVKDRLKWSEDMFKKSYISRATHLADRMAYDELMIQIDPKHLPLPPLPDDPKIPAATPPF